MKYIAALFSVMALSSSLFAGGRSFSIVLPEADMSLLVPYADMLASVSIPSNADKRFLDFCAAKGIKVFYAGDISAADLRTVPLARSKVIALAGECGESCSGIEIHFLSGDEIMKRKFYGFSRSLAQTLHGAKQLFLLSVETDDLPGLEKSFHNPDSLNSFDMLKVKYACQPEQKYVSGWAKRLPAGGVALEFSPGDIASCLQSADMLGVTAISLTGIKFMTPEKWTLVYDWLKAGAKK